MAVTVSRIVLGRREKIWLETVVPSTMEWPKLPWSRPGVMS
jgi:hypothetical protein